MGERYQFNVNDYDRKKKNDFVIVWIFLILFTACLPLFLTFKLSNGWNSSIPTSDCMDIFNIIYSMFTIVFNI